MAQSSAGCYCHMRTHRALLAAVAVLGGALKRPGKWPFPDSRISSLRRETGRVDAFLRSHAHAHHVTSLLLAVLA